eukprot:gnl/Spiro4/26840_TR13343_c0_g1_i1.p1 gnl/Spiro4/26840_TR13343_c0_g1~~gnl/Spiro4/26840_TR13343_c0_g1_i1.p1  ORF type:complete len:523 (+),score=115.72 gnl/Spiro4/26840_TR13343_c0_g1_i1:48-1616(+)
MSTTSTTARVSSSLMAIKNASEARAADEKRQIERKRNILVLILRHLSDSGYLQSVERIQAETGVSLDKVDVADNIDLQTILQEFESYYEFKFGRRVKLTQKRDGPATLPTSPGAPPPSNTSARARTDSGRTVVSAAPRGGRTAGRGTPVPPPEHTEKKDEDGVGPLRITSLTTPKEPKEETPNERFENRLLKPMPDFGSSEMRDLAALVTRDICQSNPNVRWTDVVGLDDAKRLLKEAVVMPLKYPQFFTGILTPWRGVLLYGPPGTGKTLLAKAVATECHTTFFNISASTIVSKWRGDSEKLVRVLFDLARYHAPSTIFIDELDSIMGERAHGEHDASRRMKTEILIQMDGLTESNDRVFVLAASNLPWDLDKALLRRLEKRIAVPLPNAAARACLFRHYLALHSVGVAMPWDELAARTDGYSGSDIKVVAKEAAMRPLRRVMQTLEEMDSGTTPRGSVDHSLRTHAASRESQLRVDPVQAADVEAALASTRPAAQSSTDGMGDDRYVRWARDFGSHISAP